MAKKKRPNIAHPDVTAATRPPVVQGQCFVTFLDEARSIGNEVAARRQFAHDVTAYLREKGMFEDWAAWHERLIATRAG